MPTSQPEIGRTIYEKSVPGRVGVDISISQETSDFARPSAHLLRGRFSLPGGMSELDVVRHYSALASRNFGVDSSFYPLGSCTMKYNPKAHEDVANLPGLTMIHPAQPIETVQGALQVMYELQGFLTEITGMSATSLQPSAGAQGEFTGMSMIRSYHEHNGEGGNRRLVLVPDSAHGTNPATAAMTGKDVLEIPSNKNGDVDLEEFIKVMDERGESVAALMLTIPGTSGLFDRGLRRILTIVHDKGALVHGDGANLNATMGQVKLGEVGVDVMQINVHKTFATPHGAGGPGAGPVSANERLKDFLPSPVVVFDEDRQLYDFANPTQSIGRVASWFGNFGVLVRAFADISRLGPEGIKTTSEMAVLNANYLRAQLIIDGDYHAQYGDRVCMHETVFDGTWQKARNGVTTLDVAKALIDRGIHPPTIYFPHVPGVLEETIMMEPTEAESQEVLDMFAQAMHEIALEAESNPERLKTGPHNTDIGRLDEVSAARKPILRWKS